MTSTHEKLLRLFLICSINILSCSTIRSTIHFELISAVHRHFRTSSVFLLRGSSDELKDFIQLRNSLRTFWIDDIFAISMDFESLGANIALYKSRVRRPLFVVELLSREDVVKFARLTRNFQMAYPVWLIILRDELDPRNLTRTRYENIFHLTFDTEMLVFRTESNEIEEWYSLHDETRTAQLATWDPNRGLILRTKKSIWQRRRNLENTTIVLGLFNEPTADKYATTSIVFTKMIEELTDVLNLNIRTVIPKQNEPGTLVKPDQNPWNYVINMLERGQVDVSTSELAMTVERMTVMNFTYPLVSRSGKLYIRRPEDGILWSGYSKIFSPQIWAAIGLSIIFAIVILLVISNNKTEENNDDRNNISHYFLLVFGIYCQQGLPVFPASLSLRVAYFSIFVSALVVFSAYGASLTSYLAITNPPLPFSSLEGFLNDGSYKLITLPGTTDYNRFARATNPILIKIFSLMKPEVELPVSIDEALYQVCEEKVAFYIETPFSRFARSYAPCGIVGLNARIPANFAIITSKNNPFYGVINYYIKQTRYKGIYDRYLRLHVPGSDFPPTAFYEVTITAVTPILISIIVGIALSIVILLMEHIYNTKYSSASTSKQTSIAFAEMNLKQ